MQTRRPLPRWLSVTLVAVAGVVILLPGPSRSVRTAGSRLLAPVEMGISGLLGQVDSLVQTVSQISELSRQNQEYREEIDRLRSRLVQVQEVEQENQDLRALLDLKPRSGPGQFLPVRVIARDPSPYIQSITVDRGTEDGVQDGMVVVSARGLVGRVVRAEATTSQVLLITDVNSTVSARIQDPQSRATGLVRGIPNARLLLMQRIPQEESVQTDSLVITSGLGGVFPEGLVIGRIVRVQRKDVDVFQEALIEPAVDMYKLERLYVVSGTGSDRSR